MPVPSTDPARGLRRSAQTGRRSMTATVRFGVLIALVAGLGLTTLLTHPSRQGLLAAAHSSHVMAPLVAVVGSALLVVVLTPRTLLAFVSGALFGAVAGAGYVILGVTAGAVLSFCIGRLLGRDFVAGHLRGRFALIEQAVARRALTAVMISRLIPMVPFGLCNYALGTTSVGLVQYLVGTFLGAAPATVAYAALGAATMKGDPAGAMYSGIAVGVLAVGGSIGTYLVWRRRPRKRRRVDPEPPDPAPDHLLTAARSD